MQDSVLSLEMASGGGGGCAENIDEEPRGPPPAQPRPPHRPPPSGDQDQLADYDFVEEPAKEFFCAVTLELLVEPQQTDCCGHHISAEVARRLLEEGKACPMCQQPRFTTHPDKFHGRKIRQLIVRCPNKKSGCVWEGELGDVEAHVGRCPKQPWQCLHCPFAGLREGGEEHLRMCEQFPVACPNRCETGHVQRARVQQHLLECPLEIVSCEYAEMGCGVRLPRSEMREHVRESGQDHLLKMCAANLSLSRELSRKVAEKEQQITELHRDMRHREEKMSSDMIRMEEHMEEQMISGMRLMEKKMQEQMKENEERMNASLREIEKRMLQQMKEMEVTIAKQVTEGESKVKQKVDSVQHELGKRIGEVEATVKTELEENEKKMSVSMTEMEGRMRERIEAGEGRTQKVLGRVEGAIEENRKEMKAIEVINVGRELSVVKSQVAEIHGETAVVIPPVEYTVPNISVLKAQDKKWKSAPFYTHRGGYKMCIGVWPNGRYSARGSHVSVGFYKMRDANTEGLKWPASLPVTIQIMNHTTGRWERECTNGNDFTRSKPTSECCESSTNNQCLPHSELAPYLKDDCLHIRVSKFIVE